MMCSVFDESGRTVLRTVEASPECNRDFCDRCGDCLHCYGSSPCPHGSGGHYWVAYGEAEAPDKRDTET